MAYLIYVVVRLVHVLLFGLALAMMLRAILSWFSVGEEGFFVSLLYSVTEPVIVPMRALFYKMGWFQDFPLDMPFFFTFLLISVLSMFL